MYIYILGYAYLPTCIPTVIPTVILVYLHIDTYLGREILKCSCHCYACACGWWTDRWSPGNMVEFS